MGKIRILLKVIVSESTISILSYLSGKLLSTSDTFSLTVISLIMLIGILSFSIISWDYWISKEYFRIHKEFNHNINTLDGRFVCVTFTYIVNFLFFFISGL